MTISRDSVHFVLFYFLIIVLAVLAEQDFYTFSAFNNQGKDDSFEKYRGKVTLVVNVASECGYTDGHYKDLVKLYDIMSHNGKFTILAFPCNQFGGQEPALGPQIEYFVRSKYKAEFPIYSKIDVIGSSAHPVYKYLIEQTNQAPDWNFWKYLVDRNGKVINAWGPQVPVKNLFDIIKAEVEKEATDSNKQEL